MQVLSVGKEAGAGGVISARRVSGEVILVGEFQNSLNEVGQNQQ